jgi:hypothetical protein
MPLRPRVGHLVLGVALALAACGGRSGGAQDPWRPGYASHGVGKPAETPNAKTGDHGEEEAGHASAGPMKPLAPSAMAAELEALGLDVHALPPLGKIPPDKLRQVMKTFTRSLGVDCTFCHDENDFRAPTKHKQIAARMWNDYVRALAAEDGTALYCDSCHGGRKEPLDRHDKKALASWMDANFVAKLKRVDGADHSCDTCHGEPFEPRPLRAWVSAASAARSSH